MEVEKRGVKGGFFQLFDWNGKSRKKLFSSKSDVPGNSCSYCNICTVHMFFWSSFLLISVLVYECHSVL